MEEWGNAGYQTRARLLCERRSGKDNDQSGYTGGANDHRNRDGHGASRRIYNTSIQPENGGAVKKTLLFQCFKNPVDGRFADTEVLYATLFDNFLHLQVTRHSSQSL